MKAQPNKRTVLAIDDDEINLMVLTKCVQEAGFSVKAFDCGEAAWDHLQAHAGEVDIVLLDKMMPGMNGMHLLKNIKLNQSLRHLPVILQTGDAGVPQMREGLESGAYYYLTKPFHPEILAAILHSAAGECAIREELKSQMSASHARFISSMKQASFAIKTHAQARLLAASLSQAALYPEFVAVGLMEMLSNAIEHGNLEMGYEKKCKCLWADTWTQELDSRAASKEYGTRQVHVEMLRKDNIMQIVIRDEGCGFDWHQHIYSDRPPGAATEPNGRGISKAMIMLDDLSYNEKGNEVRCNIALSAALN
jgi:CheY-like chemotaxis protein